ncbi:hypothetical protein [Persephonella sp.]
MNLPLSDGKRYSGEIKIKRFCEKYGIDMDFSLVFSGIVNISDENVFILHSINPSPILKFFKKENRFTLFLNSDTTAYNLKALVKDISERKLIFQAEEPTPIEEKRRFHRFYFCCKDLGSFIIEKDDRIMCEGACVFELSRSGLGVINSCIGSLKVGDRITVKNTDEDFKVEIEILHLGKREGYEFLGGKITKTNLNLINYIIRKYIKVSEKIINEAG